MACQLFLTAHYSCVTTSVCSLQGLFYEFQNHHDLFPPSPEAKRDSSSLKRIYSALGHQRQDINQRPLIVEVKFHDLAAPIITQAHSTRRGGTTLYCFACPHHESHFIAIRKQSTSVHSFMESSLYAKANSRQRRQLFLLHAQYTPGKEPQRNDSFHHPLIKAILLLHSDCHS